MTYKGFILEEKCGIVFAKTPQPIFESTNFGWYHTVSEAKEFIDSWLKRWGIKELIFKH